MEKDFGNIRVGVIGAGTMGVNHVRLCSRTPGISFQGLYDPDPKRAQEVCGLHGCVSHGRLESLLDRCDAVTVAAPTELHLEIGAACLERGVHVMMEKPLAGTVQSARALVRMARERGLVLMVGHIERYNPAISALMDMVVPARDSVISINTRRLAPFDGARCMDMDVLYDLMIHDIDLVLELAGAPIKRVNAAGVAVFSAKIDNAHALIEFENSVSASLWVARCSPQKIREITVVTMGKLFQANTIAGTLGVCKAPQIPAMDRGVCAMGVGEGLEIPVPKKEPLGLEMEDFFSAVSGLGDPVMAGPRALEAMEALELVAESLSAGRSMSP